MIKKKIDIPRTIFYSFWSMWLVVVIFAGGIMYSASNIGQTTNIKEIFFWGALTLVLGDSFFKWIRRLIFIKYKKPSEKRGLTK